jgi:hypothetical protein
MDRLLDRAAIDHLAKLLGMLGSAHAGERAAAGRKADEFIKRRGLTWSDVIRPIVVTVSPGERDGNFHHAMSWREMREFCLQHRYRLTPKELRFLMNIGSWCGPLTERQQVWLNGIYARLRGEVAA